VDVEHGAQIAASVSRLAMVSSDTVNDACRPTAPRRWPAGGSRAKRAHSARPRLGFVAAAVALGGAVTEHRGHAEARAGVGQDVERALDQAGDSW
jgi:hypothetical protein